MKTGIYTSEFWLSLATIVAVLVLAVTGEVDPNAALAAVTGIGGVYTGSRAAVKRQESNVENALAQVDILGALGKVDKLEGFVKDWAAPTE